jgi:hypothetical protein
MIRFFVILAIIYDPKSRTLDRFMTEPTKKKPQCCSQTEYRADHPVQCESPYYQSVQFGNTDLGCPVGVPVVDKGAILCDYKNECRR